MLRKEDLVDHCTYHLNEKLATRFYEFENGDAVFQKYNVRGQRLLVVESSPRLNFSSIRRWEYNKVGNCIYESHGGHDHLKNYDNNGNVIYHLHLCIHDHNHKYIYNEVTVQEFYSNGSLKRSEYRDNLSNSRKIYEYDESGKPTMVYVRDGNWDEYTKKYENGKLSYHKKYKFKKYVADDGDIILKKVLVLREER